MSNIIEFMGKVRYENIAGLLNDISINYAILKGCPYSYYMYNDVSKRYSSDIDILLSNQNTDIITKRLHKLGFYRPLSCLREARIFSKMFSHQTTAFKKSIYGIDIYVDVNFDIFWGEYEGQRIDIDAFLCDSIEMDIYGVKVKTLPPLKAMIQLILHHYKDMNSIYLLATRKSIKYEMFKDVYYLLKNNLDTIPLDKLYMMSTEYDIIPYVFYVLYYTGQIFDDDVLQQYIEAFRTPEGEALLNCYGLCAKERREWKYDFKTRLEADNLYELIKNDLTEKDMEKIAINKRVFMGVSE